MWIVQGGPRCGPCFRLARWMDDHHATLEKDYVIVKVMDGVDEHVAEVIAELPRARTDGIPWYAITEPDGTVLATSEARWAISDFPVPWRASAIFARCSIARSGGSSPTKWTG